MADIRVKGLKELQSFLDTLPAKIESNIMRGALRSAAKPMRDAAIQNCPTGEPSESNKRKYRVYNGALRDSIRISGRIDKRAGTITAKVVAGGKVRKTGADVFYANMVEFGTRPHSTSKVDNGVQNHPGVHPRPFMRPAFDAESQSAVVAAGEYIKKRLSTKHGINTADIEIGIEEE